jgi:hypothetical protein
MLLASKLKCRIGQLPKLTLSLCRLRTTLRCLHTDSFRQDGTLFILDQPHQSLGMTPEPSTLILIGTEFLSLACLREPTEDEKVQRR